MLGHGIFLAQPLRKERTETLIGYALGLREEASPRGGFEGKGGPEGRPALPDRAKGEDETPEGRIAPAFRRR
jgi:hypothetical protein